MFNSRLKLCGVYPEEPCQRNKDVTKLNVRDKGIM